MMPGACEKAGHKHSNAQQEAEEAENNELAAREATLNAFICGLNKVRRDRRWRVAGTCIKRQRFFAALLLVTPGDTTQIR